MNSFLYDVALYVKEKYEDNLHRAAIVFPNRRAALFFGKYLAGLYKDPVWAPSFLTISDLMNQLAGLKLTDNLAVIAKLYHIYKEKTGSGETFDDFYPWGEIMLADFDEIDKYKVNPQMLFQNIVDYKAFSDPSGHLSEEQVILIQQFWDSFNAEPSTEQEKFLALFKALPNIYKTLTHKLLEDGVGYEGFVYRQASVNFEKQAHILTEQYNSIIFTGFAAINTCEYELFHFLQKKRAATFFWDYDDSWIDNKNHEASKFVNKYRMEFPMPEDFRSSFSHLYHTRKAFTTWAVPSNTGQAQVTASVLEDMDISKNPEQTAVILTDENLLLPLLYALPDKVEDVNITMGYPLKISPAYSLYESLFALADDKNIRREGDKYFFYHKPVLSILRHELIGQFTGTFGTDLINIISNQNLIYVEQEVFTHHQLLGGIFQVAATPEAYQNQIYEITRQLLSLILSSDNEGIQHKSLVVDMVSNIYVTIQRLNDLLVENKIELAKITYIKLLRKALSGITVPFSGEPLKGLQVMGILETRNLDFKNLIMLSMNEDVFPRSVEGASFIPYSLRKAYQLTTPEHSDALYAYHFYRLIQRSKNIHLIYNSVNSGLQSGEKSRYLYQLIYDEKLKINQKNQHFDISLPEIKPILVPKSNEILQKLNVYAKENSGRYLSPSAMNTYLDCRLKFYFRYVAGIREKNEIKEEMDQAVLGEVLHKVLENLYTPFLGKVIQKKDLEAMLMDEELSKAVDSALTEILLENKSTFHVTGINIVKKEVLKKFVALIIKYDKKLVPFTISGLENKVNAPLHTAKGNTAYFKGSIDRVDVKGGTLRIVDYKTGRSKTPAKDISQLTSRENKNRNTHQFQVFLYCLLYQEQYKPVQPCSPAVYYIRNLMDPAFDSVCLIEKQRIRDFNLVADSFREGFEMILDEIFDPEIPFDQTEDLTKCQYCEFIKICHRN